MQLSPCGANRMKPQVLILEDDFLMAEFLRDVVEFQLGAQPITVSRVSDALAVSHEGIALGFLDIELSDGKSFPVARTLMDNNVPFVFVSGNEQSSLPSEFKDVPFLSKPVTAGRLVKMSKALTDAFA